MNKLMKFENKQFGEIRMVEIENKPYFIASDVAKSLGYKNSREAVKQHCRWVAKHDIPHPQSKNKTLQVNIIPEGDMYRLITNSELENAEKFEKWVFDEVLPQIRKTGTYMTELKGQEKMFKLMRSEINEMVSMKIKEIEEKCSDYYRPSSFDKSNISSYIKKRLGITKANDEYELVKQRVLLKLGATKWEDVPVEELRKSLHIVDESIRIIKLDRPTQQVSFF
ncbi:MULTISPECIES: BRO-N domain-containing protein [Clostridium]|uniref:BRO-N domain-containing protein n=2 Tax=Clostridiaceae TaxID=31979 RepID=UPI0018A8E703|nr:MULTISPECIES: BRO family protein [Clostridium]MBX9184448.1 hypothetical protein [Clostridium sp. K04]MDU3522799.1 BRO family protein [Clostridium saudiense]